MLLSAWMTRGFLHFFLFLCSTTNLTLNNFYVDISQHRSLIIILNKCTQTSCRAPSAWCRSALCGRTWAGRASSCASSPGTSSWAAQATWWTGSAGTAPLCPLHVPDQLCRPELPLWKQNSETWQSKSNVRAESCYQYQIAVGVADVVLGVAEGPVHGGGEHGEAHHVEEQHQELVHVQQTLANIKSCLVFSHTVNFWK